MITQYSTQTRAPQFLERAKAQTLVLSLFRGGSQVAITSGTVDVIREDGTKVIDGAAVTVDASGSATYALLAGDTTTSDAFSTRWRVEWTVVVDGETITYREDAHLVRTSPYFSIGEADLLRRHSDLASLYPEGRTSWQHAIDEARDVIWGRLMADARYPYLIVSQWSLREPGLCLALSLVCRELSSYTNGRGRWADLAAHYQACFETLWAGLNFEYDDDQDGDADRREGAQAVVTLTQGPVGYTGPVSEDPDVPH